MQSMCSHDEVLPLSKEMRLKAQCFMREISVGEQQSNRTHSQNLATEYLPSKKASVRIVHRSPSASAANAIYIGSERNLHRQRTQSASTANAIRFDGVRCR